MKNLLATLLVIFQVVATPLLVVAQTTRPAVLYFSPPGESATTGNVNLDSSGNFTVDVKINTHGANSTGADVIVLFTTTQLQFVSGSMPGSGSGSFYPTVVRGVPTNTGTANSTGRISMARVIQAPESGSSPTYTNGDGVFAQLTFKPLASNPVGTAVNLNFEYTAGATNDSNVAGTDVNNPEILGNARNAALTVQQGAPTTGTLNAVTLVPASATLGVGGSQTFTATAQGTGGNNITSGVTYSWTLSGVGSLNSTTGSSVIYTAGSAAGSATVTITATQGSVSKTDNSSVTVTSTTPPPSTGGDNPVIDRIAPTEGEDTGTVQLAIYGRNFGSTSGRVYVGGVQADLFDWAVSTDGVNAKAVVIVPKFNIARNAEYLVRLVTADGKEAVYMGYLAKTGLPLLPWLVMFPLNGVAAVLIKRRWFRK